MIDDKLERWMRDACARGLAQELRDALATKVFDVETSFALPLHWSAEAGQADCGRALLEIGFSPARQDSMGRTPLAAAAHGGHPLCVAVLVDAGAEIDAADEDGDTPLMLAASTGHAECVALLMERGANADLRNARGLRAADIARDVGFHSLACFIEGAARSRAERRELEADAPTAQAPGDRTRL